MEGCYGFSTTQQDKDKVDRAVEVRTGSKYMERPIQLLYPLELHCDVRHTDVGEQERNKLNVNAGKFQTNCSSYDKIEGKRYS